MYFYDTQTDRYNITENDIRLAYPNTSIPTSFSGDDRFKPIIQTQPPQAYDREKYYVALDVPQKDENGNYVQTWKLVEQETGIMQEPPKLDINMVIDGINRVTQRKLDLFARTRGYDSILSATSYANSKVEQFRTDALRAIELRDETWQKLYEITEKIRSGEREVPRTYDEIESELPVLEW